VGRRGARTVALGDGTRNSSLDAAVAALAGIQHGVVALRQLIALGITASGVRDRVARGALHRIYRGVYTVGHASLSREGRWMAAVLAHERAALSYASAADLHGLRRTSSAEIDVTVSGASRSRPGIRVHRSRMLLSRDIKVVERIPCTSVARTLLDLAALTDRRQLERACDRALTLRTFDQDATDDVLARAGGHRGAARLRAVLHDHELGTTETRSPLEERFLSLVDAIGLRRPHADYLVDVDGEPVRVDFAWVEERVLVELDSWRYHGNPVAHARDARRTRRLSLNGWCVLRVTSADLEDAVGVERDLRAALGAGVGSGHAQA
jgi:predicted transcriptional regulator of viral defense system